MGGVYIFGKVSLLGVGGGGGGGGSKAKVYIFGKVSLLGVQKFQN